LQQKIFGESQKTTNFDIAQIWIDFGTAKPIWEYVHETWQ